MDELKTDEMKHQTSIFTKCLEERIGNSKQSIFNIQNAQDIYYTNFGDDPEDDNLYMGKIIEPDKYLSTIYITS